MCYQYSLKNWVHLTFPKKMPPIKIVRQIYKKRLLFNEIYIRLRRHVLHNCGTINRMERLLLLMHSVCRNRLFRSMIINNSNSKRKIWNWKVNPNFPLDQYLTANRDTFIFLWMRLGVPALLVIIYVKKHFTSPEGFHPMNHIVPSEHKLGRFERV